MDKVILVVYMSNEIFLKSTDSLVKMHVTLRF